MKTFKEHILAEQHEITVGGYTTKYFYMCGSAQEVMSKNAETKGAEELTILQDLFYKLEREVLDAGEATDSEKQKAEELYNRIMSKAGDIKLADEIGGYMRKHLDSVLKGEPKPGFGRTDLGEALTRQQRIKRGLQMKRLKKKIAIKKKIAAKKMASPEKLRKRARKLARKILTKKLLKGKDPKKLSFAEREKLEKKLEKKKAVIERISKKLMPKVKKAEKERLARVRGGDEGDK